MKTYDGKTSFNGKAVCKGTSEFMRMLVQPSANGDLKILNVMQDTNMDGKLDITSSPDGTFLWSVVTASRPALMQTMQPHANHTAGWPTQTAISWAGKPLP